MGDAAKNPRSPQYTGPMPDWDIVPTLQWRLVPKAEWLEANKEALAGDSPPQPNEVDILVEIFVAVTMVFPSRLIPPANWKKATAPTVVLVHLSFAEFKASCVKAVAGEVAAEEAKPQ